MTDAPELDLTGLKCPMPIVQLNKHIKALEIGEMFVAFADDPAFCLDVRAWCKSTGHELVRQEESDKRLSALIRKN